MSKKNKFAAGIIWGLALLVIPVWLLSYPETTLRHNVKPFFIYSSQLAAISGFSLYAFSFILSTRIKWLEDFFGGLDKIYHTHHSIGKFAFILLLVHPAMLALRWLPENPPKALWYVFPVHRRLEIDIGSWALWGLVLLMLFTLFIKLPYDKWKITHKLMGLFFLLGVLHIFLLEEFVAQNPALTVYLALLAILGLLAFLYKTIFFDWLVHKTTFRVDNVNRLSSQVMEISLLPDSTPLEFIPGQFCFFSFMDARLGREAHPYTICSSPGEERITIMVKALGDYTQRLYDSLQPGVSACVEGPYGRFDYKHGKQAQIWIGGGVGIVPFISWGRDLKNKASTHFETDLYYCVNNQAEALHLQEFEELEHQYPGFHVHLICADKEGFLQGANIPEIRHKDIFICGPKEMRKVLLKEFHELRVPDENIHFEDFDFS